MDSVKVDAKSKTAQIKLNKGALTQDTLATLFKGSRYSVTSFKEIEKQRKAYRLNITGMT